MGIFDDEGFFGGGIEELFNRLSGEGSIEYSVDNNGKKRIVRRANKRNVYGKLFLDKVKTSDKTYIIFDLSGRKDIVAKVNKNDEGEKILEIYEEGEFLFDFPIDDINTKGFESEFKNGILEVSFKK